MKFSIALGLLFAGLACSQQIWPLQAKLDSFLRESQHLKPTAQLTSAKQNGPIATVTYQDGPMCVKYQVKTQNDGMQIVGIQKTFSFSSNLQFQPVSIQDAPQNPNNLNLQPLPLIMPHFSIQANGHLASQNVFDEVETQMEEMKKRMEEDRQNFQQLMEQKRLELQQRLRKNFESSIKQTPLLGAGDHDFNQFTNIQLNQPLIGGDHNINWATRMENGHPIVGGGDHDFAWVTVQIDPTQPLLGGDRDFDPEFIPLGPLIGAGEHDNWVQIQQEVNYPLIGEDDHDNWKVQKNKHHQNMKEHHLKKGKHGNWRHEGKQKKHHSNMAWMNRSFENDEVAPFLKEKLPEMMKNGEIISVQNKGFAWGKGFTLDIQIKGKDGNIQNVSVYYKPRKQEFLIDKISAVQTVQSENILAVELASESKPEKKEIPAENLVAPNFIQQESQPAVLGGQKDPENAPEFINLAKQIEFVQDNHIKSEKIDEKLQVPLLGGENDIDRKIEKVSLLGGESDPDHVGKTVEKESEPVFDVTGLPLPGGETDIDHNAGLEVLKTASQEEIGQKISVDLIKKVIDMVKDISQEEVEDIEQVEEPKEEPKVEKLQHLIK